MNVDGANASGRLQIEGANPMKSNDIFEEMVEGVGFEPT